MRAHGQSRVRDRGLPPLKVFGEPKFVPSTANCTVPPLSNVPEPAVTVAVKVTLGQNTDGFGRRGQAVVVRARLVTVWPPLSVPLLVLKFVSPL